MQRPKSAHFAHSGAEEEKQEVVNEVVPGLLSSLKALAALKTREEIVVSKIFAAHYIVLPRRRKKKTLPA